MQLDSYDASFWRNRCHGNVMHYSVYTSECAFTENRVAEWLDTIATSTQTSPQTEFLMTTGVFTKACYSSSRYSLVQITLHNP